LFLAADVATIKSMNKLALRFGLPADLEKLIDTGVFAVTGEDDATKTLRLVIPSPSPAGSQGPNQDRQHHLPDYNAQFCHYYHETPGDLPNFYVAEKNSEGPDEPLVPSTRALSGNTASVPVPLARAALEPPRDVGYINHVRRKAQAGAWNDFTTLDTCHCAPC
jgi:hypothetical protein